MLIVSSIRLMLDLSVFCVPRPCLYMLGSSSQPKCIACVNLSYTHCMWTSESNTPDHHAVLRNNELLQRCTVRGNTFLKLLWGIILFTTVVLSKQDVQNMINITCNQIITVTWYGQYHIAPLISILGLHDHLVTGMTPWSPSSCLHEVASPTITSTTMANG